MITFHCDKCAQQVFFENTVCFNCGSMLGYQPTLRSINSFDPAGNGQWRSLNRRDEGKLYKQCANYVQHDVCNWMLPADDPHELCASCQLTVVIPALSSDKNRVLWSRLEAAKRRLLFSLATLRLTPVSKEVEPETGLAFQFLEDGVSGEPVMTGHANGVITLNIAEADPAERERTREQMHERYRTLLGHFRHESGHYYFDRLVVGTPWIDECRELFGDERADYGASLQRHYSDGPPADWESRFVSSYASAHPWEDWAETWAHYLHMMDTLETAHACGVSLTPRKPNEPALEIAVAPARTDAFDDTAQEWFALTYVLNSLSRSIGMPDAYPFTLGPAVLAKLGFVHRVVRARMTGQAGANG
ncbi:zinc-binding metallopeptidase family protein [Pseudoduganella chitinolytica]|uniref:Zinc-binding peptidase n=1 Tax=Pseudoduganella chitinolytica TaxID=34070 RepID=A0ABY8BGI8_9BURK|nr:putative zinc-binding peptidase [Pseudoduganella chitinolytica]WEF34086.1 putative zinc-binding peptidase [Pseudoduganella chitinolytica]